MAVANAADAIRAGADGGHRHQPRGARDGVLAPMRLEVADHDVGAFLRGLLRFFQHAIGLPDPGGITQENREFPPAALWIVARGWISWGKR